MKNKETRRKFIKKAGAAAIFSAGSFQAPMAFANELARGKKRKVKVGLVGCGGRGTGAAVQALNADPDVVLHAMADAFEDRLTSSLGLLKKAHGGRIEVDKARQFIGFDAYQKLIDSGVDVVLLASPPGFRPKHLEAAIDAGKHVFYEKPVAVDAPGVRKVLEAAKKAKAKNLSMVSGFCFRYDLQKQALYGKVLDGAIGDIKSISSTRNGGELWYKERQPGWTDMEYQLRNWYYQNWLSGDFIVEMFVHSLDMITWALGEKTPIAATATGGRQWRTDKKYGNIYDHFAMEYDYADGTKGFCFTRQQRGGSTKNGVEIQGSLGNAYYEGSRHEITGKNPWKYGGEVNDMYQSEHDALFKSIREGAAINDGEMSAKSTLMGIMGRMAAYTGQTITWDDALNSTEVLGPDAYDWNLKFKGPDIAVPGKTKFI
ncbi:Gfo/Idh/MocA family protein [Pseudozobellia thermophila]|uniref:Predicted dehydrogenase n=1 Tax=Pseudozobellia thermophila TaxID=192903 RepID=A0A1M6KD68_9FLAO|nr:Gfo/Idh/MocA family oxidoreductase [Pseudozobellia thermophila]SHJ56903.1 Predicted dehydrogenase [Pseudozobellia thermophila]